MSIEGLAVPYALDAALGVANVLDARVLDQGVAKPRCAAPTVRTESAWVRSATGPYVHTGHQDSSVFKLPEFCDKNSFDIDSFIIDLIFRQLDN